MSLLSLSRAWAHDTEHRAQLKARRNAMIALTACTRRRAEREEVERFLAERAATSAAARREAPVSLHA